MGNNLRKTAMKAVGAICATLIMLGTGGGTALAAEHDVYFTKDNANDHVVNGNFELLHDLIGGGSAASVGWVESDFTNEAASDPSTTPIWAGCYADFPLWDQQLKNYENPITLPAYTVCRNIFYNDGAEYQAHKNGTAGDNLTLQQWVDRGRFTNTFNDGKTSFSLAQFGWQGSQNGMYADQWDQNTWQAGTNPTEPVLKGINSAARLRHAIQLAVSTTSNVHYNTFAEIVAEDAGGEIFQDIKTTPGTVYTWKLKHRAVPAARETDPLGVQNYMEVLVGPANGANTNYSQLKPSVAYRTKAMLVDYGNGIIGYDAKNPKGQVFDTGEFHSGWSTVEDQWAEYTGSCRIPNGQNLTRFTFKSTNDQHKAQNPHITNVDGNAIDDVEFSVSYPLTYDLNGGEATGTRDKETDGNAAPAARAGNLDAMQYDMTKLGVPGTCNA